MNASFNMRKKYETKGNRRKAIRFYLCECRTSLELAKTPMMVAVVDERGNATGQLKSKPDLPGNMTCRLRVMLHCIKHPFDEVAFKAMCEPDKVELLELRKLNPTKKVEGGRIDVRTKD